MDKYDCVLLFHRLFGMTGVVRTSPSHPHSLGLHPHVCWPDFINPLVLLLLYYTLVTLLHKWVHVTEEVCRTVKKKTFRRGNVLNTLLFYNGLCTHR